MKNERQVKIIIFVILAILVVIRQGNIDIVYTNLFFNILVAFAYLFLCFAKIKSYIAEKKLINIGFERLTPILTLIFKWVPFTVSNIIFAVYLYIIITQGMTLNACIAMMHAYIYFALSIITYLKESDVLLSDNCIIINGMKIDNNSVNKIENIYTNGLWERYKLYSDNRDEFYLYVNKKSDKKFTSIFFGKFA